MAGGSKEACVFAKISSMKILRYFAGVNVSEWTLFGSLKV